LEPFSAYQSVYTVFKKCLQDQIPCALVSYLEGPPGGFNQKLILQANGIMEGDLDLSRYSDGALEKIEMIFKSGESKIFNPVEGVSLLAEVYPPRERLVIVGAVHTAEKLVSLAHVLGFETIMVDPRRAFNNRERFPDASELIAEWPDEALENLKLTRADYVVVLTHDPKLDDPALLVALRSPVRYIGAIGSKRTNQKRLERLRESGVTKLELDRLHAPIGLDIGGRKPEEIALSIMAEINKVKYKG
jgi:xanthine dehydrogenase accessory factor